MRKLVLWGHQLDEYRDMFDLKPNELQLRLLEYGCGPTAINAQLKETASCIISCDPLFSLDRKPLRQETEAIFQNRHLLMQKNQSQFDFSRYGSLENLVHTRQQGLDQFFADFPQGTLDNRYRALDDKPLPFPSFSFDLALSSHFLFADLEQQDLDFYMHHLLEMARVAREVRLFPLIDHRGEPSPLLGPVLLALQRANYRVEVRDVAYQLQPAGHAMLCVSAQQCVL